MTVSDSVDGHLRQAILMTRSWHKHYDVAYWKKCLAEMVVKILIRHATPEDLEEIQSLETDFEGIVSRLESLEYADDGFIKNCQQCGTGRSWWIKAGELWKCPSCHQDPLRSNNAPSTIDASNWTAPPIWRSRT